MAKKGNNKDTLGDRMKGYESVSKTTLVKRTPVIIRIDGKAFHTFTRGFDKPFDKILVKTMQETTKFLCENIQGCVFGYTQSDEITLVLVDYKTLDSCAWFDNEVQKLCSVSASMATYIFNKKFREHIEQYEVNNEKDSSLVEAYSRALSRGAMFDSRAFNVPVDDVTNAVLWRQNDAIRNSIQSLGQHYYSHKQMHGMNTLNIIDNLKADFNVRWWDLPVHLQRGTAVINVDGKWTIDENMPVLKGNERDYVERLIHFD